MSRRLTDVSLASASPRRLFLLESLGLRVEIVSSTYHEAGDAGVPPRELARRHAVGKASAASASGPRVLVAADTIVDVDGTAFGKPRDIAQAEMMLAVLSGRWHVVHTGLAVVDRANGSMEQLVESARVKFVDLDRETIARYAATGEPLDKAGAYGIQGLGALLVDRIDGDFYTVMGLPLAKLGIAWRQLGYELP